MPHMDGTGPEGKGKSSGRRLGQCNPQKRIDNFETWQRHGTKTQVGWRKRKTETLKKRREFIEFYF
jgi:hypothetical protein